MSLRVAFRTVACKDAGMGHLRRCCTLARELEACGASTEFWIEGTDVALGLAQNGGRPASLIASEKDQPGELLRKVREVRPDAVVVDQYDLTAGMFRELRSSGTLLCAIDDLGNRGTLEADLLVNGSPYALDLPYYELPSAVLLLGTRFALLGPGFRVASARLSERGTQPARVLVTLGGSDPRGWTWPIVRALRKHLPDSEIEVVLGPMTTAGDSDSAVPDTRIYRGLTDLEPLMRSVDIAVTAGGQTTYELAALGVPAIAVCAAPNQERNIAALARVPTLESVPSGDADAVGAAAARLAADPARRARLAASGRERFDGAGAKRVARVLLHLARHRRRGRS